MNAGQLVMTGISGHVLTEEEKDFLQSNNIGGVIIFAHNFVDPAQLAELINSIQSLRDEYPLFISIDNEGGRVFRTRSHFTQIPSMLSLARLNSPKLVYEVHKIMAEELKVCGLNINFSPCADILTNPANKVIGDRSFGTDPDEVEKYVSAAIRGLQTHGIMACAKHFPGHGGTTKDSHFDLPLVKTELNEIIKNELIPFQKASKARVEFMMMAHLLVDALDAEFPTSLSPKAYELLRTSTKFKGIIITDDMEMKAITDKFSTGEAAVLAILAGADMVEYRTMIEAKKAFQGIQEAIKTKRLSHQLLEEKLKRVVDCKSRNLANYKPVYIPELQNQINIKSSQVLLKEITDKISQLPLAT